jgi:3-methyladenine DNA glycosylase AlkD
VQEPAAPISGTPALASVPSAATVASARLDLIDAIRTALRALECPPKAVAQQRYMKSTMPFHGLTSPQIRAALRPILADPAYRIGSRPEWEATIRTLWDGATHREHWYAALALARHRHYRAWRNPDTLVLYRHLVETGAWWDVVDDVATHLVREVREAHPDVVGRRLRDWSTEPLLWVRRTAILAQVGSKARTDTALLSDVIEPNIGDTQFFIRKAIGWSLRDYARTNPAWVRAFVARHPDLSGLSRREALKHLG